MARTSPSRAHRGAPDAHTIWSPSSSFAVDVAEERARTAQSRVAGGTMDGVRVVRVGEHACLVEVEDPVAAASLAAWARSSRDGRRGRPGSGVGAPRRVRPGRGGGGPAALAAGRGCCPPRPARTRPGDLRRPRPRARRRALGLHGRRGRAAAHLDRLHRPLLRLRPGLLLPGPGCPRDCAVPRRESPRSRVRAGSVVWPTAGAASTPRPLPAGGCSSAPPTPRCGTCTASSPRSSRPAHVCGSRPSDESRGPRPGPLSTLQDLGRVGWAHLGVPRAGALDRGAAALARRLVGGDRGRRGRRDDARWHRPAHATRGHAGGDGCDLHAPRGRPRSRSRCAGHGARRTRS